MADVRQRIDALTQSILGNSFSGELVPQDPIDERASVLLERIDAQRVSTPKARRGAKPTAPYLRLQLGVIPARIPAKLAIYVRIHPDRLSPPRKPEAGE